MRSALLGLAAVVLLAGCVGGPAVETATPTATPACETDVLLTDAGSDDLTPRPIPARPDDLTRASVRSYAVAYERNFTYNHALSGDTTGVDVQVTEVRVQQVQGGFSVRMDVWRGTEAVVQPDGGTTVVQHGDRWFAAHYFVSDRLLRRMETRQEATPPPVDLREGGLTLECWG